MPKKKKKLALLDLQNPRGVSKNLLSFLIVKQAAGLMEKQYYSTFASCWICKWEVNKFWDSIPATVLAISITETFQSISSACFHHI